MPGYADIQFVKEGNENASLVLTVLLSSWAGGFKVEGPVFGLMYTYDPRAMLTNPISR